MPFEYKHVGDQPLVAFDGLVLIASTGEEEATLRSALHHKQLAVGGTKVSPGVVTEDVDWALSFLRLQPQTIMLVAFHVPVDDTVTDYAKSKGLSLVLGEDHATTVAEMASSAVELYRKRNKEFKPDWVSWKTLPIVGSSSELTVWHKVTSKAVTQLAKDGCTHIVSLLGEKEKPELVEASCQRHNITWIWVPIQGASEETLLTHAEVMKAGVEQVKRVLLAPEASKVLVHCSAGIHRTGVFTFTLLRSLGLDKEGALDLLYTIRPVTARGVGENRLHIAESAYL